MKVVGLDARAAGAARLRSQEEAKVSAPRVLILSSQTLFAESLSDLLERHGYQVIGVQPYDDTVPVLVATLQPSVVVLDVRAVPPSATSTLLDCAANIRIVHVSLDSRVIAMYDRRESSATVQDFFDLMVGAKANQNPAGGPSDAATSI